MKKFYHDTLWYIYQSIKDKILNLKGYIITKNVPLIQKLGRPIVNL